MRGFLIAVLTVIAAGVVLIAYGLLAPRVDAMPAVAQYPAGAVMQYPAGAVMPYPAGTIVMPAAAGPAAMVRPASYTSTVYDPIVAAPAPRRTTVVRRSVASPKRDWKKTALVIGGSTAAGAGVGGIVGGGKGALIGAAIGGGASTLFEALR